MSHTTDTILTMMCGAVPSAVDNVIMNMSAGALGKIAQCCTTAPSLQIPPLNLVPPLQPPQPPQQPNGGIVGGQGGNMAALLPLLIAMGNSGSVGGQGANHNLLLTLLPSLMGGGD